MNKVVVGLGSNIEPELNIINHKVIKATPTKRVYIIELKSLNGSSINIGIKTNGSKNQNN